MEVIHLSQGSETVLDGAAQIAAALSAPATSVGHLWLGMCLACETLWETDLDWETPEVASALLLIGAELREARETLVAAGIDPGRCVKWLHRELPSSSHQHGERSVERDLAAREAFVEAKRFCVEHQRPYIRPVHLLLDLAHLRGDVGETLLEMLRVDRNVLYLAAEAAGRRPWPGEAEQAPSEWAAPHLARQGRELTANPGRPVTGRSAEIRELAARLDRPGLALLVGRAGVGRHAVARGLAGWIRDGAAPSALLASRVFELPAQQVLELEEATRAGILDEAARSGAILSLGPVESIFGGSSSPAASGLLDALRARRVRAVGTLTPDQLTLLPGGELPWFEVVHVMEPTPNETVPMLQVEAHHLETLSGITIDHSLLELVARWSSRDLEALPRPAGALALLRRAVDHARSSVPAPPALRREHLEEVLAAPSL
jgi:ATP-dependent Clp protease ATP-binding subunit ClpA